MSKIEELSAKIAKCNQQYRAGQPSISDAEYDQLVDELKALDPNNQWFQQLEPAMVSERRKVKLPIPMKSLNKVKNFPYLKKWCNSLGLNDKALVVCMPKFDGLSLLRDEQTGMVYSRGGAENEGQDCTAHYNAAGIYTPPTSIHFTFGEFVFSRRNWHTFKEDVTNQSEENFKSPRNTAAGLLNRDTPSEYLKYVSFFRYGVDEQSLHECTTFDELCERLRFKYEQPKMHTCIAVEELSDEYLISLFKAWNKEYPIDGIVVYVNDLNLWETIGRNQTTGNPLYAVAYKHPDFTDSFETTVKGISWKVSKAGALKPVVNIETVDTGDCNMENPTGYNAKWIYEHHIAKGAKILVTRSGGVIPKILETLQLPTQEEENKLWEELCICPHCGAITQWNESQTELCCSNKNCPGVRLAKIVFFFKVLEADNIGEETITRVFDAHFDTLKDILNITFDELLDIDGFGETIANQFLNAISLIREGVEVTYLMHASDCFNGIGQVKAKAILSQLSEEQRFAFCNGMFPTWSSNEELMQTKVYKNANVTLQSFMRGILPFYQFVAENGLKILPMTVKEATTGKYSGFKVCFTGVRDSVLEAEIQDNGGEIVSGVSKRTTHLIVADKSSQSSKATKARQLGIPILTIDEFQNLR